jgi:hypothetical protein
MCRAAAARPSAWAALPRAAASAASPSSTGPVRRTCWRPRWSPRTGAVRVVNAFQDPDLFWALKGGGGGTFGVGTRFTFRTHELPDYLGIVAASVTAASDAAYQALAEEMISFYRESLFNPNWGEQIHFAGLTVSIAMLFQGSPRPRPSRPGLRSSTGSRPGRPTTRSPGGRCSWRSQDRTSGISPRSSRSSPRRFSPPCSRPTPSRARWRITTTGRPTKARSLRSGPAASRPGCHRTFSTPGTSQPSSTRSCKVASSGR